SISPSSAVHWAPPQGSSRAISIVGMAASRRAPRSDPMSSSIPVDIDDDHEDEEAHEINVTPFIDVMLVLLIIFMVVAPLSTVDLPVDLPSATALRTKKPEKPIYITIQADLGLAVGESQVTQGELVRRLDAMPEATKDSRIFLRADRSVPYESLMGVLEALRLGGYLKIALVALEQNAGIGRSQPAPADNHP